MVKNGWYASYCNALVVVDLSLCAQFRDRTLSRVVFLNIYLQLRIQLRKRGGKKLLSHKNADVVKQRLASEVSMRVAGGSVSSNFEVSCTIMYTF